LGASTSAIGDRRATIGCDFVNSGFGAYAWLDENFSFAMDIAITVISRSSV
jgi:hypothetical protein